MAADLDDVRFLLKFTLKQLEESGCENFYIELVTRAYEGVLSALGLEREARMEKAE